MKVALDVIRHYPSLAKQQSNAIDNNEPTKRNLMHTKNKTKLAQSLLIGIALTAVTFFTGCAVTKDYVSLAYVPQANVAKIAGADTVSVNVAVADSRSIKDKVSAKKNGYGMEMAAIIAKEDVAETLKKAVEVELANRGFHLNGGGITVGAELSKFYSDFKTGFFSGSAVAEVTMNVQVKKAGGNIAYSKLVNGEGGKENLQLASGSNAKIALDAALKDAVAKLFGDTAFVEVLLKAGNQ